jgi:MFS family permease
MLCLMAALIGLLLGLLNPVLPLLTSLFAGKEFMGTASGVTGCIFQAGAIVGPWLVGMSADMTGNFEVAWFLLAGAALMGVLCVLPMSDPRQK